MAQVTTGGLAILSHPKIYSLFQSMMGANKVRRRLARVNIRPQREWNVLDIGCGPADIIEWIDGANYWGFDISEAYITRAKERFGSRGHFFCKQLDHNDLESLPMFDVVLAIGLLHHLDDGVATDVIRLAFSALKPGGRLVTLDPCLDDSQSPLARFIILKDRGLNVRTKEGYETLARAVFPEVDAGISHQYWIPYTHCTMECRK